MVELSAELPPAELPAAAAAAELEVEAAAGG